MKEVDDSVKVHCSVAFWMRHTASETARRSCDEQLALFTTEWQCKLLLVVPFLNTSFKHKSV
jgi:hypothetical protein